LAPCRKLLRHVKDS